MDAIGEIEKILLNWSSTDISSLCKEVGRVIRFDSSCHPEVYESIFHVAIKLFDRVYGDSTTGAVLKPGVKVGAGGWLRLCSATSMRVRHMSKDPFTLSPEAVSLLNLLSPNSQLMDILQHDSRMYEMPIELFPAKTILLMNSDPSLYDCAATENHRVLDGHLKYSLFLQISKAKMHHGSSIALTPLEYFCVCLARYAVMHDTIPPFTGDASSGMGLGAHATSRASREGSAGAEDPGILFVTCIRQYTSDENKPFNYNKMTSRLMMCNSYLVLLKSYLDVYVPNSDSHLSSTASYHSIAAVTSSTSTTLSPAMNSHFGDVLLAVLIAYWIDKGLIIKYPSISAGLADNSSDRTAVDVSSLDTNSIQWHYQTLQCVYVLTQHLLNRKDLADAYSEVAAMTHPDTPCRLWTTSQQHAPHIPTAPMYIIQLQQPLFDLLRCLLGNPEKCAVNTAVFTMAVELWLLYIQPWKWSSGKSVTGNNSSNIFTKKWKAYVICNYSYYSTLMWAFIRTVSKINLLVTKKHESLLMLVSIERVLKVFSSPELRTLLQESSQCLLEAIDNSLPHHALSPHDNSESHSPVAANTNHELRVNRRDICILLSQHHTMFPDIQSILTLEHRGVIDVSTDCLQDGVRLVGVLTTWIHAQQETLLESSTWSGQLSHWAHSVFVGESKNQGSSSSVVHVSGPASINRLKASCNQLTTILSLPPTDFDKHSVKRTGPGTASTLDAVVHMRDMFTGKLTVDGKKGILAGRIKSDRTGISWTGDCLSHPVYSWENKTLVAWLTDYSKEYNDLHEYPLDSDTASYSWSQVWDKYWKEETALSIISGGSGDDVTTILNQYFPKIGIAIRMVPKMFKGCFRLNLRPLAARSVGIMGRALLLVLCLPMILWVLGVIIGTCARWGNFSSIVPRLPDTSVSFLASFLRCCVVFFEVNNILGQQNRFLD